MTLHCITPLESSSLKKKIDMRGVAVLVLAGGAGTRLSPLTLTRCKPALSFGGTYRLIDVPLSNALNSGCSSICVLTQFLSASLHRHIQKTYPSIELLSAEQKPGSSSWYQGTADAIRQNCDYLIESEADYFLILSGDQLYQMDFEKMAAYADATNADLLIAALPVDALTAPRMGVLKVDEEGYIIDFCEKPHTKAELDQFERPYLDPEHPFLGSMGIYLFKRNVLIDLLKEDLREDFGKHLIPTQVKKGNTLAYIYQGYWEDIGTIESFYKANMNLTCQKPLFNLSCQNFPLHKEVLKLPPARFHNCEISQSLISEGSNIHSGSIKRSIIGPNSQIGPRTTIEASYLFGNCSIGENCSIQKAIIDENVQIGNNVQLINQQGLESYESDYVHIRSGIIIINRGVILPDNFIL